ncbi:molybdate ABC transporter substrate-binding protein [Sphingomonas sp. SORGH_AS_0438]|uniref:molybdate ABC transporter substrate-binding protein n=1 Tax=Sphingomonas sp. SORGH_AS_0438 TaxID=3041756 RepID=UPI002857193A|nr:molybdate ABC transporter substrate-binding protein [Sphingomonas sp. SORGH_AS_0438]MDR6126304.1 molybdenum ABC transporter molybdate-binding protein [Sphingomonas sp. SORGH_AS_0438]
MSGCGCDPARSWRPPWGRTGGWRSAIRARCRAGRYAQAALTRLGLWSSVEQRLAPAQDVRAALAYVARGASPLGIVYESDAYADRTVRLVSLFPAASHPPIVYPVAVLRGASAGASDFYRFLGSGAARSIFARYRFRPLG